MRKKIAGEPVSRILFAARPSHRDLHHDAQAHDAAIIPLGPESLRDSSSLPEGHSTSLLRAKRPSFAKANSGQAYGPGRPSPPIWPCSTRGFPCPGCCHPGGGLLPHLFTLAKCARPKEAGFRFFRKPAAEVQASPAVLFSVALSVAAPPNAFVHSATQPPGVTRRVALPWPALASSPRPESGLSSRPFRFRGAGRRSPGSPARIIIRHVPRGKSIVGCYGYFEFTSFSN